MTTLRLLVHVPDGERTEGELELRRAVREALPVDAAGREWQVRRLTVPVVGDDPALARDFVVEGDVPGAATDPQFWDESFELADRLRGEGAFAEVEPDLPVTAYVAPEGQGFSDPPDLPESEARDWARRQVRVEQAWATAPPAAGSVRGARVLIGHPDTGYTLHPALDGALDLVHDWDQVDGNDDAVDPMARSSRWPLPNPGHGTGTASVIVGRSDADPSVLGIAPEARLVPIRAVESVVQFFDSDVARAVHHARKVGCQVISMSLGGKGFFGLRRAIAAAIKDGCIVMAAAGNYVGLVTAPASYDECIAVAAVNAGDLPWVNSSHGSKVAISAPGEGVWIAGWNRESTPAVPRASRSRGTSHAVAHVAGAAALWIGHHGHDALVARYGRENIHQAFLTALTTAGARCPERWEREAYGSGILDVNGLLQSLPELPSSFLEANLELTLEPAQRIADVLPELSPGDVRARLETLFDARGPALDAALRRHGAQVHFRLLTNDALRRRFILGDDTGQGFAERSGSLSEALASVASPTLRADIRAGVEEVQRA